MHILAVDDDEPIRELLASYLAGEGYRVTTAHDTASAKQALDGEPVDLVVCDLRLPDGDGLGLVRQIRTDSQIPVIILSSKDQDVDRIVGLELGADDYLVKPFNPRELLARIRAVLRRVQALPLQQRQMMKGKVIKFDRWTLDVGRQELCGEDGVAIALSTAEFRLLKAFLEHPGIVLSRDQLLDLTAGRNAEIFDRSIDNQVSRLRKKVERDPKNPSCIRTHWGGGYSITVEVIVS